MAGANNDGGVWTPDCWHVSPDGLIAEAKAQNNAGYQSVFGNAGKHSNPPNDPRFRDT